MKFAVALLLLIAVSSVACQDQVSDCYNALKSSVAPLRRVAQKSLKAMDSEVVDNLNEVSTTIYDVIKLCDKVTDTTAFSRHVQRDELSTVECLTYLHDIVFLAGLTKESGQNKDWENFFEDKKDFLYNLKKFSENKSCMTLVTA